MEANGLSGMGISGTQSASLSRCELHTAVSDVVTKWLVGQYEDDKGAACIMLLPSQQSMQCNDKSPAAGFSSVDHLYLIVTQVHPPCLAVKSAYIQCFLTQLATFIMHPIRHT